MWGRKVSTLTQVLYKIKVLEYFHFLLLYTCTCLYYTD